MSKKTNIVKNVLSKGGDKPSFGTDPLDPWSVKSNINETALLDKYLKSRGINPQFATKDMKVAHSKTNQFKIWARSHYNDQFREGVEESVSQEHTPAQKRLHVLKKAIHFNKEIRVADGHKKLHSEAVDKKDTITFDIPLLIRVLEFAREDLKSDIHLHKMVERLLNIRGKGTLTMNQYGAIVKEEVEQLDELQKTTLMNYAQKAREQSAKLAKQGERAKSVTTQYSKYKKATQRLAGADKAERKVAMDEDTYHDSMAATQMPFDGANNPDDTIPAKRKNAKEMSKSARIIKSIYKRKGIKEDMYDHEKEDKSVASYGKKPKMQELGVDDTTKESPQAAAVLSGGKTLTGAPRDTIEIDPMMKTKKQATFGSQKSIK